MEKKHALLFFDSDGTIIGETNRILPLSTVQAIRSARANGHLAFLNTGRPFLQTDPDVMEIGFDGHLCSCGMYIRIGDTVVQDVRLDPEYCRQVRDLGRSFGLEIMYESYDAWFYDAERSRARWTGNEFDIVKKTRSTAYDTLDVPEFRFEKFIVWKDDTDAGPFLKWIRNRFRVTDRILFFECVPLGYTKATAINAVIQYLHAENSETYAFGDSANDLDMLNCVDVPVLMGNSPESVRNEKYYLTDTVENNGIEKVLSHFNLI